MIWKAFARTTQPSFYALVVLKDNECVLETLGILEEVKIEDTPLENGVGTKHVKRN